MEVGEGAPFKPKIKNYGKLKNKENPPPATGTPGE